MYHVFLQVEAVIDKILESARTGEIGDGKIFCKAETYFFLAVIQVNYTLWSVLSQKSYHMLFLFIGNSNYFLVS